MLLDPDQARKVLAVAAERRFAILAVNADSPAAVTDCLEAARAVDAPIMVETSLWQLQGWSFGAGDPHLGMARYLAEISVLAESLRYRGVPVFFHTDHIKGPVTLPLLTGAVRGFEVRLGGSPARLSPSSISLDSSEMSEAENIAAIGALCAAASEAKRPLTLEMEAGVDAGVTPLEEAARVLGAVERQHPGYLALWAPGVGTQHGFSEGGYPGFDTAAVKSHREQATAICGRPIGIALHGSTGLPSESLRSAVAAGVTKVNWSSESLKIRSAAALAYYQEHVAELDPKHKSFKLAAMDNGLQTFISARYRPKVEERILILGGKGAGAACRAVA